MRRYVDDELVAWSNVTPLQEGLEDHEDHEELVINSEVEGYTTSPSDLEGESSSAVSDSLDLEAEGGGEGEA